MVLLEVTRGNFSCSWMFQNHIVFIPAKKDMKYFSGTTQIKSDGIAKENIENITKSDSNFTTNFCWL